MKLKDILKKSAILFTAAIIAFSAFAYSASGIMNVSADEQAELEQKLKENKAKQSELEKKIKDTRGDIAKEEENQEAIEDQIATVEDYIRTLVDLINDYDDQIAALENEITVLEGDIAIQERKIADKRIEIDNNIYLYEQRLRAMYLSGNDSVASIILGSTDFFDLLMKIELVKRVADYNNDLITTLHNSIDEYEAEEMVLENQKAALEETEEITDQKKKEVEARKAEWDEELEGLEALYKESKRAIKELEDKKAAYQADQKALDKAADEIEAKIQEIIRQKARAEYMGDLEEGSFLWPVPGYFMITSGYGSRWGTTHRGIDISGSGVMGADITAANSGVVILVSNTCTHNYGKSKSCGCGGGFGNYCIIDHGGGYQTLYGHATKITVSEGQKVTTGDVIGTVGSTGDSTGAHLHFEVRVDGDRVDPQKFNLIKY